MDKFVRFEAQVDVGIFWSGFGVVLHNSMWVMVVMCQSNCCCSVDHHSCKQLMLLLSHVSFVSSFP